MFIKKLRKTQEKLNKNGNYASKSNLYILLIFSEKMLMSAEHKESVT